VFRAEYELHHLHIIDGTRANYLLQRFRMDVNIPLRGRLGVGASGDYLSRYTFYQAGTKSHLRFPEVRVFSQLERANDSAASDVSSFAAAHRDDRGGAGRRRHHRPRPPLRACVRGS
jgi:hypothetical protein